MLAVDTSIPPPSFPVPRARPASLPALLVGMMRNPIAVWTEGHFERPVTMARNAVGPMLTLCDPVAIRHVLLDHPERYAKDALQRRVLSPALGVGVLLAEAEDWRRQRRIVAPLFTPKAVAVHAQAMAEAADHLVSRWEGLAGQAVDIGPATAEFTLGVLARTLFADGFGRGVDRIRLAVDRYLDTMGRVDPLDLLGAPDWLPRLNRLRGRAVMRDLHGLVQSMMEARRQRIDAGDALPPDLLSALLAARDPETGEGLDDVEIRDNLLTFLTAGHETTANALTWTLLLLARHPEIRAECEAEADAAGDAVLTAPDAPEQLPRLRAVIEEAMRLYPPAALLSRVALVDDRIGDVSVAAGTVVVMPPYLIHRHGTLWDEPHAFRPARFLPENRGQIPRFAYMPFGAGPRVCVGQGFAMLEMVIAMATILRRVRLDMPPGAAFPMPVQRITLRPAGQPRLVPSRRG